MDIKELDKTYIANTYSRFPFVAVSGSGARVTRLAFGLPADSGVGYSDPLTLKRAISGRIACG